MSNRLPASRCILFIFLLLNIVISPIETAFAHWIQTHQKVTDLSKIAIANAGRYMKICDFLDTTVVDQKDGIRKTYLRSIMEGLRDADLLANGLYKVECHQWNPCWDWNLKKNEPQCYPNVLLSNVKPDLCNSIADWPVGDHGYNPNTGKGFNSLITDYDAYLSGVEAVNPDGFADLLKAIGDLYPDCKANPSCSLRQKLIEILSSSSALAMAESFYARAKSMWNATHDNHYVDAMYNLGIVLHLVQDMTVPHHTRLIHENHEYFERYCWENTLQMGQRSIDITGDFSNLNAADWVERNASKSMLLDIDPVKASETSIRIAASSSAGMIVSFFKSVGFLQMPLPWLNLILDDSGLGRSVVVNLPDTGQTRCYNNSGEIICPQPGQPFYGQDGNYQKSQPAYRLSPDGLAVTDVNTGQVWQQADDGVARDWNSAVAYCEDLNLGGYSDWRLPKRMELVTIVDYGRHDLTINKVFSILGGSSQYFWSGSTGAYFPDTPMAWHVDFAFGYTDNGTKSFPKYVRCVRGGPLKSGPFVNNNDGTVTDTATNLIWQQADDGQTRTWQDALSYCESLGLAGKTDWRLPNISELQSIVDDSRYNPAIYPAFGTWNTFNRWSWSGSTCAYDPSLAWSVDFGYGYAGYRIKDYTSYVRCVRGGLQ